MVKEEIFTLKAPYREDMTIYGYSFGKGEDSACMIGAMRGNEVQQLYACSQLVKILTVLERTGGIVSRNRILVIPSVNYFSMNIEVPSIAVLSIQLPHHLHFCLRRL